MNNVETKLQAIINGLQSAQHYLSEDLDAICDDTMRDYAEETLKAVEQSAGHSVSLKKNISLFLDALADIAMEVGYKGIEFKDSKERSITLRAWAQEFVDKYANTDWEQMDYIILVGEFAVEKVNEWVKDYPKPTALKFRSSYVLGTEAVREYSNCVNDGEKWNVSSLCDCGSVSHGEFATLAELEAYKQGIEDATGWLESERMMTDEEWIKYLEENKDIFREEEDADE